MRVVVDPALAAHDVCNRFRLVEERCPIFTDQQDFFVKQEVVYRLSADANKTIDNNKDIF